MISDLSGLARRYLSDISRRSNWRPLPVLTDLTIEHFRSQAFIPAHPATWKIPSFEENSPASVKWFQDASNSDQVNLLNLDYLGPFGATIVPLELSTENGDSFQRANAPLDIFLQFCKLAQSNDVPPSASRFYLAQAALSSLPAELQADLPTPDLVLKAGSGDVYDANIWMGPAPTYTPLHRDPNPNVFVQLAVTEVARILPPGRGDEIFDNIKSKVKGSGSKAFRGDEMMMGNERKLLEVAIWGEQESQGLTTDSDDRSYEVLLKPGSGLFIPQGWWHSIRGIGSGITASANWWFR